MNRPGLVTTLVGWVLSLGLGLFSATAVAQSGPAGSMKLKSANLQKKAGFYCGKVKNKWVPGTLTPPNYFLSHATELATLNANLKKARTAKERVTVERKIKLLTSLTSKRAVVCDPSLAAPKGSVKLASNQLAKSSGFYCGLVKNKWVPGKVYAKVYFWSHATELAQLKTQVKREKDKKKKKALQKKVVALTSSAKKRSAFCDSTLNFRVDPTPTPTPTPTLPPLTEVEQIGASDGHSCAVSTTGGVSCWGQNWAGMLGDGTRTDSIVPVPVSGLESGATDVDLGKSVSYALLSDGSVKHWGTDNFWSVLGSAVERLTPEDFVVATPLEGVQQISIFDAHGCLVTTTGVAKCWGENLWAQLGFNGAGSRTPVAVPGAGSGVKKVAAGYNHSCAVFTSGGVKCWGLGAIYASPTAPKAPTRVQGFAAKVNDVVAGRNFSCALLTTGGVQCWGDNYSGQLGDGTGTPSPTPVFVQGLTSGVMEIVAGVNHACALLTNGTVMCWGVQIYRVLDETGPEPQQDVIAGEPRLSPVAVDGLPTDVTHIEAGWYHTCAVLSSGGAKCWGDNFYGQLGNSTKLPGSTPLNVVNP